MLKLETHEQQVAGLAEQVTSSVVLPLRLPSRSDGRSTLGLTQKGDHTIGYEVYADRQRHPAKMTGPSGPGGPSPLTGAVSASVG